jgi:hypothetical protein
MHSGPGRTPISVYPEFIGVQYLSGGNSEAKPAQKDGSIS